MRSGRILISLAVAWLATVTHAEMLPLWTIQGTSNQIHLLGSVHFLRAQDYPLPAPITDALAIADVVVMELDLGALNPIEAQALMLRLAIDPKGRDLEDLMGARSYRQAHRLADDVDIDLATLRQFEPWYAAMQITQFRLIQLGFDSSYGVDVRLAMLAMQQGKEIRGLETLDEQLKSLDSLPMNSQKMFLIQTLEEAATMENKIDDIIDAWRAGDTRVLERELATGLAGQPKLYEQLLVQRNRNWTETIIGFIDDRKNYLIVVGAMHLVGDDSMPRMLEDAGYSTRQVTQ